MKPQSDPDPRRVRRPVVVGIVVVIALIHALRAGSYLHGSLFRLYYAYASDILVPFGAYFLLCMSDDRVRHLGDWRVKAALVFGAASFAEIMQGLGVPFLGRTFDIFDIVMYGAGVLLAASVDRLVLARWLPGWSPEAVV